MTATTASTSKVPHVRGLPVLGSTLNVALDGMGLMERVYPVHGQVFSVQAFGRRWVMLCGPDAVGAALENRDRALANGPGWAYLIGPFFKRGVMLLDFDEHHAHRRIMQEAFTSRRLEGYLDQMTPVITEGLDRWPASGRIAGEDSIRQLTLDVATRTFMGAELGPEADRVNHAFRDCVRAGTAIVRTNVPGGRWAKGLAGRRVLEEYLYPQVPGKQTGNGADLFTALCHAEADGERFTEDDVVNHMIFLLLAAHDTSTSAMSTMLYHVANQPDWQERCRAESVAVGRDQLTFDDLASLPSLDLVFNEALRLVSPVPGVARAAVKDTEILGYRIPKGTLIAVSLGYTHRNPDFWTDPEVFDPERFAEGRREDKVHRHAFEPFGGGVHKCIGLHFAGMQVKAVLHQVLLRYRVSCPDGYEMKTDWRGLPSPSQGLPLVLAPV